MVLETNQGKHCYPSSRREVCTKRERERVRTYVASGRESRDKSMRLRVADDHLSDGDGVKKFNPSTHANAPLVTVNYYPDTSSLLIATRESLLTNSITF